MELENHHYLFDGNNEFIEIDHFPDLRDIPIVSLATPPSVMTLVTDHFTLKYWVTTSIKSHKDVKAYETKLWTRDKYMADFITEIWFSDDLSHAYQLHRLLLEDLYLSEDLILH